MQRMYVHINLLHESKIKIGVTLFTFHENVQNTSSNLFDQIIFLVEKSYNSDPNLALVMELWAAALERLGMLDVAINKAENAIAMAKPVSAI